MWKNKVPDIGSRITKGFLASGRSFELYINVIWTGWSSIMFMYSCNITEKNFKQFQEAYSLRIYTWIYLYYNCTDVSRTRCWSQNKAFAHLFLVGYHELCAQPYFARQWDHGYEHCKLYPIHVYSNSNTDKEMYNTVSKRSLGQTVSLLSGWCRRL